MNKMSLVRLVNMAPENRKCQNSANACIAMLAFSGDLRNGELVACCNHTPHHSSVTFGERLLVGFRMTEVDGQSSQQMHLSQYLPAQQRPGVTGSN